jgi:urease beta subunit
LEQEIEILRESQAAQDLDIGEIGLGKTNEMLETENRELVERLRVQLEDFYRVQEENTLL